MGINRAPFALPDCDCCPPGGRKETVTQTTSLPAASRHAFLLAGFTRRLPREVLLRIFAFAATVERRVVTTRHMPSAAASASRRRHAPLQQPDDLPDATLAFAGLCLDIDDAPP